MRRGDDEGKVTQNQMGTYRGNTDEVIADAARIAERLIRGEVTIRQLQQQYHCGYEILKKAVLSQISKRKWKKIKYERLMGNGKQTRFQKGIVPWNKGTHFCAGGRSAETRFKKGQIRGAAARRYRPVGTITVRHDSPPKRLKGRKRKDRNQPWGKQRRWIKFKDSGPPQYCWIPYARYIWQQKHGPVPKGFFVVHKDDDQMNDVIENLTLVDHGGHLLLQQKRDPGHVVRRRAAAGKSAKARHEVNRQMRKQYGPLRVTFGCAGCGATYCEKEKPVSCVKCGGGSFEKIKRRQAG